jgi:Yip1 domain
MSIATNTARLVFTPRSAWESIARESSSISKILLLHTIPLSLIPAVCWYYGVTTQGWSISGDVMRLTAASALPMCILFFFAMVFGVLFLGYMVWWMSTTYGERTELASAVGLISYTATPFFLAGVMGLYPVLWLDILLGVGIATWCIYLLYLGVAPMMHVSRERGFLFASAVFAVALVAFVGLLTATVLLWEYGPTPEYTY